jgi:micrococcal nuclease
MRCFVDAFSPGRHCACWLVLLGSVVQWPAMARPATDLPGTALESSTQTFDARVSRVVDGDTLWVKPLSGGPFRKLRLEGLDAPEICQKGGGAARQALALRVLNQVVAVRVRTHDDYGRALAQVQHQGADVGAALVQDGLAWTSRWHRTPGMYAAEESQARAARKGVFAEGATETPWAFRRRYGPCPSE